MPPNNPFFSQPSAPSGAPAPAPQPAPAPIPAPQAPTPIGSGDNKTAKPTVKNPNSTQNTLQLSEVRDNMVIMLDGSFRAVIRSKAINFDLMSDREREGVEFSYQNFLNSLNFPIQILVRSQRVDIGPYIDRLIESRRSQDNMLLGVLMDDYINFIDELSVGANIMEKSFYIVIPYFPQGDGANLLEQGKGFFGKLFARPKNTVTKIDTATYEKAKEEIKNRVDSVMAGMFQIGVQSAQLDTKSLGELYYNFYNPDTAVRQPLGDFENTTGTFVKKAPSGTAPTTGGVL
jgi:type IV secretory pathway VirB4 component